MLALAIALTLTPPVPGAVARPFEYAGDPFARGLHRGVDLAARPGQPVHAACGGRVAFAGRAGANGGAVTIRCGAWSVTHLPLREPAVHAGDRVEAGAKLGTAAGGRAHAGLHLGVRRTTDARGYVDPAPLLQAPRRPAPPAGPGTISRRPNPPPPLPAPLPSRPARNPAPAPSGPVSHPAPAPSGPVSHPAPAPSAPAERTSPAEHPAPGSSPLAPWLAWAGLALLLAGAAGAGTVRVRRAAPTRAAAAPASRSCSRASGSAA